MTDIFFLLILFFANTIQAITGFAGTVLAMPPSILLLGVDDAKVVLNTMALLSGLMIAIQNRKHINYRELGKMVGLMLIGMVAGMFIYKAVSSDILLKIYGAIVVLIGVKNLILKKQKTLNAVVLTIILLLAGIIHGMFVSGGALLVIYAVQVLKDKDEFRATVAPVWVVLNSIMMAGYFRDGLINKGNIKLILISIVPLFVATLLGHALAKKINQKVFLIMSYILLIISGISILL